MWRNLSIVQPSKVILSKDVYVCLLDTRKAFDTIWQEGLIYKLYNIGMNGKTWRIFCKLLEEFRCSVLIGKDISSPFNVNHDLHQGAPCSMFLYTIYVKDLLAYLNNDITCMCVCDLKT